MCKIKKDRKSGSGHISPLSTPKDEYIPLRALVEGGSHNEAMFTARMHRNGNSWFLLYGKQ